VLVTSDNDSPAPRAENLMFSNSLEADTRRIIGSGCCVLIAAAAFVIWTAFRVINAPSTEEVMRRSLSTVGIPELEIAFALHPDACSITKASIWRWSAECVGVPMHFYEDTTVCDPGPPKTCGAAPASYENCRSFYWDVDLDGNTSDPLGVTHKYGSISEGCRPKSSIASERLEMARRGIAPIPVQILDYAGFYTGRPRPLHP
jgi:hypothetical protein